MGALMQAASEKSFSDPSAFAASGSLDIIAGNQQTRRRSRQSMLQLYSTHPWVRLAEDVIAARQSAAEWFLLLPANGPAGQSARRQILNAPMTRGALCAAGASPREMLIKSAVASGELEEILDHPFLSMMRQGTAGAPSWLELSGHEVDALERVTVDLVGEWIQVLFRDPNFGHPFRWWPVPPTWVRPPDQHREDFEIRVHGRSLDHISPQDVWWYRKPAPLDFYGHGSGRLAAADTEIAFDEGMSAYMNSLIRNRARPDLLVAMKGLGPVERESFEERFRQSSSGPHRAGVTHFLGVPVHPDLKGEFVTVKDISSSPADLQAIESRRDKRDVVLQVAGVPQNVIGATESSNRATAYHGEVSIRENRTVPDLESRCNALQQRFFEERPGRPAEYPGGWILSYRLPQLLDIETLVDLMRAAPSNFTENDFRRAVGLPGIDGGDERRWVDSGQLAVVDSEIESLLEIFRGEGP